MIDLIPGPRAIFSGREQGASRFDERPVGFFIRPNRALIDPRTQHSNLIVGKALAFGRHYLVRVWRSHPRDELARGTLAGNHEWLARFSAAERILFVVQTKVVLLFVRAVAFVTTFDKNELNVAGEINRALRRRGRDRLGWFSGLAAANGEAKGQHESQKREPSPDKKMVLRCFQWNGDMGEI